MYYLSLICEFIFIFILILISFFNLQYFRKCPYCKKRFTKKTPDYFSCNFYRQYGNANNANVCYKCYKTNKEVIHDVELFN